MSLTGLAIKAVNKRSAVRFESATVSPQESQNHILLSILRNNEDTEYGKRFGFSNIRNVQEYRDRVPVVTYENLAPDMDRVLAGEKRILTTEDPVMFAQTSGTTGKPKFIPVTPTCQDQVHKHTIRTWLYHAQKDHPGLFDGKIVSLVSPAVEGFTSTGIPYGSTSGHIYKNIPAIIKRSYSLPYSVFEIQDYRSKYYVIMRVSLEHDVRFVSTANPSSILKMCEKANECAEEIIRDIQDGTLSSSYEIEPRIRAELENSFRPHPERARQLDEFRHKRSGILKPADYWPNLELIGCWKAGTVGHYLEKFPDWFDPDGKKSIPVRDWGFLASEVRGSIPLFDEDLAGALNVAFNFYEFVEVDAVHAAPENSSQWEFCTVGEIEEEKEYYIFITTTAGLYRYDINDIIQVKGRYNQTPMIVFLRKGRGMTNITGEKLSVNQVITCIQDSARKTGMTVEHFKAEADSDRNRYVIRVEFSHSGTPERQKAFLRQFEEFLQETNIEYKAKRASRRLHPPVLHVMREGWYERERRRQTHSGMRQFQAKTEVLSPIKQQTVFMQPEIMNIVELDDFDS